MKRFITAWVILSAAIGCSAETFDRSVYKDGIGSRGGAFFAAAVKVADKDQVSAAPKKPSQKLTEKAWSQAQSQGSRLEEEAMRIAQKAELATKEKATAKQAAVAPKKKQKAKQQTVSSRRPVDFERSVTSFHSLKSSQVYPSTTRRPAAPAPVQHTTSAFPTIARPQPMGLREKLVDSALWFVLTMASLTSVSNIMAVVIDHYENAIYGEQSLSLGMMVTKQRILGGIMELGSVLLMTNPQVRQLGAFFITLMYTGSLISGDLAVWEAVITGAVAAMALAVFADETMYNKERK